MEKENQRSNYVTNPGSPGKWPLKRSIHVFEVLFKMWLSIYLSIYLII